MRTKQLLRFYFRADAIEYRLNALIKNEASRSAYSGREGVYHMERIAGLIEAKDDLVALWRYLNGAVAPLAESDISALREYAISRRTERDGGKRRKIVNALKKFGRRSGGVSRYSRAMEILSEYYCLL